VLDDFDPDAPGSDPDRFFGLPHTPEQARVVIVPVPFEATTSYGRGTAGAPDRIRAASQQIELNDTRTGAPWRGGIAALPSDGKVAAWNTEASALALPIIAAGEATPDQQDDLARVNEIGAALNDWVHGHTAALLQRGKIPAIVGGDHSVSFGAMKAATEKFPGVGVLHIDAHADLREDYQGFTWSHASVFHNVVERLPGLGHLVQIGLRDVSEREAGRIEEHPSITTFTDHELAWELASGEPFMRIAARVLRPLPQRVWVSLDVDGLDPSNCPHTGTPVPGGLKWREVMLLLQLLATDRTIVGFDLVEVGDAEWDANVGARLLYTLAGWSMPPEER